MRISNENRLRQLTDTTERGFGLTADHPDVARLAALVSKIGDEDDAAVDLTIRDRCLRAPRLEVPVADEQGPA